MKTKTLKEAKTFTEALKHLQDGTCIGIRPSSNHCYIIFDSVGGLMWDDKTSVEFTPELILDRNWYLVVEDKKPIIYVPENIHFDSDMDLLFNDDKQILSVFGGNYQVSCYGYRNINTGKSHKLVKVERSELKEEDLAYRGYFGFSDLSGYCKIIDNNDHVYITDNSNAILSDTPYFNWYKVVKI